MKKRRDLYLYDSAMYARFAFLWNGGEEGGQRQGDRYHFSRLSPCSGNMVQIVSLLLGCLRIQIWPEWGACRQDISVVKVNSSEQRSSKGLQHAAWYCSTRQLASYTARQEQIEIWRSKRGFWYHVPHFVAIFFAVLHGKALMKTEEENNIHIWFQTIQSDSRVCM
jgi:hypothetical protein